MIPFLSVVAAIMVGAGIIWRLRQTRGRATGGARLAAPSRAAGAQPRQSPALKPVQEARKAAATEVQQAMSADSTGHSTLGRPSRRSDRVLIRIPLQVSGKDLEGNSFTERAQTMVINRNGASFVLRNSLVPEERITVKNLQTGQSCRFRARRGSKDLPGGLREWGIECVEPAPASGGFPFRNCRKKPPRMKKPPAACWSAQCATTAK